MKKLLLVALMSIALNSGLVAADGDTTKINFFTEYDIQQWKGSWWHKKFDYINPNKKYKKAYMVIDLGCASYGCCVWDYTFQAYVMKPVAGSDTQRWGSIDTVSFNGVTVYMDTIRITPKSDNYEVGRLITPYGTYMRANSNGYTANWKHPYIYDVTDYLPLLKDSFGLGVLSGGYDGKKGFNISVNLYLIEGETKYEPSQVHRMYQKSYKYVDADSIDKLTPEYKFKLASDEKYAKFRTIITGHGQNGEFSPIEYRVSCNNNQIFTKRLWREDCDEGYIQPQGGTWIFDRCNWCPGEKVVDFEIDLTPYLKVGDSNTIDISFGDIENTTTTQQANYIITGHVITYKDKDNYDLAIEEIIAPNKNPSYHMYNSMCQGPRIRMRNMGTMDAKEAYIDYWVDKNNKTTYIWKGTLKPEQWIDIDLPAFPWHNLDINKPKFFVGLQKSKYNRVVWNDTLLSTFNIPDAYNLTSLNIEMRETNENINTNTLTIYDELNNIVFTKEYTTDGKLYKETIPLTEGCYRLELLDLESRYPAGDGLSFFVSSATPPNGLGKSSGTFKILNQSNQTLKTFNPDFGAKINYQFTVAKTIGEYNPLSTYNHQEAPGYEDTTGSGSAIQAIKETQSWSISPNPTQNKNFELQFFGKSFHSASMQIVALDSRVLYKKDYSHFVKKDIIDISKLPTGIYNVILILDGYESVKKLVIGK